MPAKSNRKTVIVIVILLIVAALVGLVCIGSFMMQNAYVPTSSENHPAPTGVAQPTASNAALSDVTDILSQALTSSLAYNAPDAMQLDEMVTIQLLLNPSVTAEELGQEVEESGAVVTGTVEITPLMKAELIAGDDVFTIVPLHDDSIQPISATETTRWQWQVTAKQGGTQRLTLVVYMLVRYDGKDYWREVETYRNDIIVNVTFAQRLRAFDWKWLIGLLITSGLVPFIWNWIKKRLPRKPSPPSG